ncbi:MAG: Flp pilus assembly protein TadD [Kiritimatiellia bacterium]|jgi:Flp pilus assembly protein TadD
MLPASHLVNVLLDVEDPGKRSLVHLELGERALSADRREVAVRHFREAASLDPKAVAPAKALRALGVSPVQSKERRRFSGWLRPRA